MYNKITTSSRRLIREVALLDTIMHDASPTASVRDLWHFGADPELWLTDPALNLDPDLDPDPNPTPDPTPFFSDFKDAIFFLHIFLPAGTLCWVLKI
jgi:hypothetical protein